MFSLLYKFIILTFNYNRKVQPYYIKVLWDLTKYIDIK